MPWFCQRLRSFLLTVLPTNTHTHPHRLRHAGANPDAAGKFGITPLAAAVMGTHSGVMEALLGTGSVNVNAADRHGATPLHIAAFRGNVTTTRRLINRSALALALVCVGGECGGSVIGCFFGSHFFF